MRLLKMHKQPFSQKVFSFCQSSLFFLLFPMFIVLLKCFCFYSDWDWCVAHEKACFFRFKWKNPNSYMDNMDVYLYLIKWFISWCVFGVNSQISKVWNRLKQCYIKNVLIFLLTFFMSLVIQLAIVFVPVFFLLLI